jgi:hypothetical protein
MKLKIQVVFFTLLLSVAGCGGGSGKTGQPAAANEESAAVNEESAAVNDPSALSIEEVDHRIERAIKIEEEEEEGTESYEEGDAGEVPDEKDATQSSPAEDDTTVLPEEEDDTDLPEDELDDVEDGLDNE